jgi:NAD(P)H-quinone oxidoreductase subunit 5
MLTVAPVLRGMNDFLLQTSWFIPFYGLIGAVLTLPWSMGLVRRTGPRPAAYFNLLMTAAAFLHGIVMFSAWSELPMVLTFPWLQAPGLDLSITLEISPVSLGALTLVTGISLLAQIFALGYMEKDWAIARFFGLMGFFEAALSGLAISDSLLLTYGLLELLTLSTYLLVGFWYAQPLVVTAARDAFLTKRVGDVVLLMGIVALASYAPNLTFQGLQTWADSAPLNETTITLIGLGLIAGPLGKCAQFPLNLWLDEAMEGPNPAGIMRNSVVVAAGAYVLIKLQPIVTLSPVVSQTLVVIGLVTAMGTSLVAIAQTDIKRTLSHSTSAYLGLVFIAVGQQAVDIALLILLTHAVSKALLFTSTGSIIATTNNQDITQLGGLWSRMPATTIGWVVGSLSLVALLPMGMFWVFRRWVNGFWDAPLWLTVALVLVNCLSAINLTRVFRLVFLGSPQAKSRRTPEVPWPMAVPLVSLVVINLLLPWILQRWQLLLTWAPPLVLESPWYAQAAMPMVVLSGGLGVLIGAIAPLKRALVRPTARTTRMLQDLLAYDFFLDKLYRLTVVALINRCSRLASWFDRFVVDGAANLLGFATLFSGQSLKYSISGQSQFYVVTIVVSLGLMFALALGLKNLWQELSGLL